MKLFGVRLADHAEMLFPVKHGLQVSKISNQFIINT